MNSNKEIYSWNNSNQKVIVVVEDIKEIEEKQQPPFEITPVPELPELIAFDDIERKRKRRTKVVWRKGKRRII